MAENVDPQLGVSKRKRLPDEVERLHNLGWAIHWLRPKSKIPVDGGWSKGPRQTLEGLRAKYTPGLNVGVRLGGASKLGAYYLAVLDVDVKSDKRRHAREAYEALFSLFPETKTAPHLISGRGNGSAHYYVKVKVPVRGEDVKARSTEKVEVEIGGKTVLRPAWEVSLLSEGRQAVAVGSVHPDTGRVYRWGLRVESLDDIPVVKSAARREATYPANDLTTASPRAELKVDDVRLVDLPASLRPDQLAAIIDGTGVKDRSAEVYSLCMAMLQRRVPESKILGIFTNPEFYLGRTAYDHAKTKNRQRAAQWVARYCLAKARENVADDSAFDIEETDDEDDETPGAAPLVLPKGFDGAGGWEDQLELKGAGRNGPGEVRCTVSNLLLIFSKRCPREDFLHFDEFVQKTRYSCDAPWGPREGEERSSGTDDALRAKDWIRAIYGVEPSITMIDEALNMISLRNKFHPVKDYLESLEWDGVERVDQAFKTYLGAAMPEPYQSTICRHFFQACVERVYFPGAKFDTVVVLEGRQGIGKSTFGRILAGQNWFMDQLPNVQDKDAALNLVGVWICELGELAAIYRSANESVKAFITRTVDKIRPPYGHRRVDYPRTTVFLGTTDKKDYLTDTAGNRRWLPVKIKGLDFAALERDRDQLWAEAMFNFTFNREKLWLTGSAKKQAMVLQETRRVEDEGDIMAVRLQAWLETQQKAKVDVRSVTMHQVFEGAFIATPYTRANMMRAGDVLRTAGYEKRHTYKGAVWERRKTPKT